MMSVSGGLLPCVLQEETVALRREGNGVILDCHLPHLIRTDLLGTRIVLYYLKVNCKWHWVEWVSLFCSKITSKQWSVPFFLHCDLFLFLQEGQTLIGSDAALCSLGIGESSVATVLFSAAVQFARLKISMFFYAFLCNCIVVLHGPGLLAEHCVLENLAGVVTLFPRDGALCSVNGSVVTGPWQLTQGEHLCKSGYSLMNMGVDARRICNNADIYLRFTIIGGVGSRNTFIYFECSYMRSPITSANEICFTFPAPPLQRTWGMNELRTQLSSGQMPFLLLNILKGERPGQSPRPSI